MDRGRGWYNGYSPRERARYIKATKRLIATGQIAPALGPCNMCGDPEAPVEYHSEDYAEPYRWSPPATYVLCLHCHRDKLHKRFRRPELWAAFLAHVRRGGYARDLKNPVVRLEFEYYRRAAQHDKPASLHPLRPYAKAPGTEWFAHLRMDITSLRDPKARPR